MNHSIPWWKSFFRRSWVIHGRGDGERSRVLTSLSLLLPASAILYSELLYLEFVKRKEFLSREKLS